MSAEGDALPEPASALKAEGNELLRQGDVTGAEQRYSAALELAPRSRTLLSNRSVARLRLRDVAGALADARACVEVAPDWPKGFARLAAALYEDGKGGLAVAEATRALAMDADNAQAKQILHQVETDKVVALLKGRWHGSVSEAVGGYVQEFDFWSSSDVRVHVLNSTVEAKYALDVSAKPFPTLDLSVPSAVGSPVVRHIFRFSPDHNVLDLCSPFMTSPDNRPTEFAGPGYVSMSRGERTVSKDVQEKMKELAKLPSEEKFTRFMAEVISAVPNFDTRPKEGEPDAVMANKMSANVRFQTLYQNMAELYGAEVENRAKELIVGIRSEKDESKEVRELVVSLREKMMFSGLMPYPDEHERMMAAPAAVEGDAQAAPPPAPAPAPAPAAAAPVSKPPKPTSAKPPIPPQSQPQPPAPPSSSSSLHMLLAASVVLAAVAVGVVWLSRGGRRGD